jgi:LacI family transcriptional regulator
VAAFLRTDEGRAMDALYCSNELLINGAIRALRQEGIRIGQDIGLIGFDDFDWAPAFDVPITVVDQQTREIGRHAGALVLAARGEEDAPTAPMPVPALVLRESCGCSA